MRPEFICLPESVDVGAGKHDHRHGRHRRMFLNPAQHIEAGTVGQMQVDENERGERKSFAVGINALALEVADGLLHRMHLLQRIEDARALEHAPEEFDVIFTIIHNQNGLGSQSGWRILRGAGSRWEQALHNGLRKLRQSRKSTRWVKPYPLPVADAPIAVEHALRHFLLEGMLLQGFLIDGNAEPRAGVGPHKAAFWLNSKPFLYDILPPGDVIVDGFADEVAWLREAEFEGGGGAHWSLRIVRRKGNAVGVRQRGDTPGNGETAAMGEVKLADFAGACVEQ